MAAPRPVEDPVKELRFTRSQLAVYLGILAAIALIAVILIAYVVVRLYFRDQEVPSSPSPWLALLAGLICIGALRGMIHCARHAYILLTPLGIEILPLFRPAKRMRAVFWPELSEVTIAGGKLVLELDTEPSEVIKLSLFPLTARQRTMLLSAVKGTLAKREQSSEADKPDSKN